MKFLQSFSVPQLPTIHSGKVRESLRVNDKTRLIVVTDRLSAFDFILETPIEHKGAVLNGIANWWFQYTQDIIDNHFIKQIDPNMTLVREVKPIRIEMVVRGYLCGSMWRGYQAGERTFSGVTVGEGLSKHQKFDAPIITPTTKEKKDRPIAAKDIIAEAWVAEDIYKQMEKVALQLFERGTVHLAKQGIILVDTKYEFGLLDGQLVLMDEMHTPDSSRFWSAAEYASDPATAQQIDKEYIRQWMLSHKVNGQLPTSLSDAVATEASKRYRSMYESITGSAFQADNANIPARMMANLKQEGLLS